MARTGFNKHDIARDACQLYGPQAHQGYDWWWHSFTGHDLETGEAKPFFVEFFLCNPALGSDKPVFGQIPGKPAQPSYLMVKAGAWGEDAAQLHRFWGWKQIKVEWNVPFSVEADDCFLTEDRTHGSVKVENAADHPEWMCADGEMSWNGRRYVVRPEDCYGYADKNWGRDFTSPWVWLSSNNLTSEITGKKLTDSVFDIGGGRPKVGHLALPRKLLSAFWYEGKPYEFNFSKAWTRVHTEFDCKETDSQIIWHVEQRSTSGRMVTDVTCEKKDMLLVNYESPDGAKRHRRLWNGGNGVGTVQLFDRHGNLVDRIHAENIGCEYGEYDK